MNICPQCQRENPQGILVCEHCGTKMYAEPQTEWGSYISQVAQGYRQPPARGIAHGVQKDAIQNAWGARRGKRGASQWGVEFALLKTKNGTYYLTITDWGTYGLTGRVYDDPEAIPDELPPDERLARFENMNFSGGNYGPGLYGRGKLIFQAASQRREIIYDSLTVDGEYRLGRRFQDGRHLRQFPKVVQGSDAKKMLAALTDGTLQPLHETGARITIVDPLDEIVDAAVKGELLEFIQETWWEILLKYDAGIHVEVNGTVKPAVCPELLSKLAKGQLPNKQVHCVENQQVEVKGKQYRIKRLCLAKADKPVPEDLRGLYMQRKGMKVGTIDLKDIPPDLEERFFGFIELDEKYEDLIAEAESLEHYGFSAQFASYRELKKFAQAEFDNFKRKLGYAVDARKTADERAREALRVAHQKLNEIMDNLGLTGLGEPLKPQRDITVHVESVLFPHGTNEVNLGDVISDIKFRVTNHSQYDYAMKAFVETHRSDNTVVEVIQTDALKLSSGHHATVGPLTVELRTGIYPNFEEIACVCRVETTTGERLAHAHIPIFVGVKKPQPDEPVRLRLDNIEFPRGHSTRVNFGEEIKNIRYVIENKTVNALRVRFSVRTLDREHDKQRIATIAEQDFTLKPLVHRQVTIPSIRVDAATYGIVDQSEVILRSRVVSAQDQYGYERGDVLSEHNIIFWINRDPKGAGIFEDTETFYGGSNEPRAEARPGSAPNRWVFRLNITHPHYETARVGDEQRHKSTEVDRYVFELMAREALYIALHTEKFEPFNNQIKVGDVPHEVSRAYNAAIDKVLATYYQ